MSRYDGPIVDAHHHFWEIGLGRQPWLRPGVVIPFRYGDYSSIKRDYLPADLRRDAEGLNLVGTVSMETEWELDDPIGEMEYTERIADTYGWPNAIVAHAVLRDPDVERVLASHAERRRVVAVRNKPGQSASPSQAESHPTLMRDPQWLAGYALLARYSLEFELQTAWWHLHEAGELADRFPETSITINHTGLPSDRSREGIEGWAAALKQVATRPNVLLKISGIGLPETPWTVENNREIVVRAAEAFGTDRIMFASNFPVDSVTGTYGQIFGGFLEITADWSPDEQRAAFYANAVRHYRITDLDH